MPRSVRFFARGLPKPQGSKRHVGNGVMRESARVKPWRDTIGWTAKANRVELIPGPVSVRLIFVMPRPKRPAFRIPAVAPDLDKLCRAVFDALSGIAYEDDRRVVEVSARKVYTDEHPERRVPGVDVFVEALSEPGIGVQS